MINYIKNLLGYKSSVKGEYVVYFAQDTQTVPVSYERALAIASMIGGEIKKADGK